MKRNGNTLLKTSLSLLVIVTVLLAVGCEDCDCPTDDGDEVVNTHPEGRIYVPNQADKTMYIYDSHTLVRLDSFDIPIEEPHFVLFSHDYASYYVVGRVRGGGQVIKYRASDDSLIAVVTAPGQSFPTALAIHRNNDTLYLTDFADRAGHTHRYDVSGENFTYVDSALQAGHQTHDIRISANGRFVVSAGFNSGDIWIYNTETGDVQPLTLDSAQPVTGSSPDTSYGPYGVLIDHNSTRAIIACKKGVDQVRIVDLIYQTIVDSIVVSISDTGSEASNGPTYMVLSPNNDILFLTNYTDNTVSVIRLSTREVVKTIPFQTPKPFGIAMSDDGSRVYVSCTNTRPKHGRVYIIDGNSPYDKLDSLEVGSEPYGLTWRPL